MVLRHKDKRLYTFPSTSAWLQWLCCCQHLWCPWQKYLSGLELPPLCLFTVMPPAATIFLPQHAWYALWNNVLWVMLQVKNFWELVFQLFDKQGYSKVIRTGLCPNTPYNPLFTIMWVKKKTKKPFRPQLHIWVLTDEILFKLEHCGCDGHRTGQSISGFQPERKSSP